MKRCPICNNTNLIIFYKQKNIPLFQNVTYSDINSAINTLCSDVLLTKCKNCNFVFNSNFKKISLDYNENYQNEQANSNIFKTHILDVFYILKNYFKSQTKVVEIGCGKGFFLEFLLKHKIDIVGFDPTYESNNKKIIKDYFSNKYKIKADFIILRHILEHIQNPLDFLYEIALTNNYKGKIYIEVPDFEWIYKNKSIEDIFNEHCNYFTKETLSMLFNNSEINYIFKDQYIYLIANLNDLKNKSDLKNVLHKEKKYKFADNKKYIYILENNNNIAIWGAGAKGNTFVNIFDPKKIYIKCVIDINKKKQGRFIAKTGHKIISVKQILNYNIETIIIMNINYIEEIKFEINKINKYIKIITL